LLRREERTVVVDCKSIDAIVFRLVARTITRHNVHQALNIDSYKVAHPAFS